MGILKGTNRVKRSERPEKHGNRQNIWESKVYGGYKNSYDQRTFLAKTSARDQARRVAWRIIKDWIDSQMAIVESEQAAMAQVFLPYAEVGKDGLSVYEQFLNSTKALPAGDTVTA
jgi:hypothetical protein